MNTKTIIAAVAALPVAIALAACGGASSTASSDTTQVSTVPSISSTTVASRDTARVPATTISSSTTVAAHATNTDPTTTATTTTAPSTTIAPSTTVARPTGVVDELVQVNGGRLHVQCAGTGSTTVVLIAGFSGSTESWGSIGPTVGETTRVCAYDRFGNGASDAPPAPQTFATQASDLHVLLQAAGEPGPYVVVGHSFGGAEAVTFASMYPTEVRGLLLVDASPPTWNTAICAVPDDGSDTAHVFQALCAQQSKPDNNVEHLDGPSAFAEVAAIDTLHTFPMIVATADHHSYAGLAASEEARLNDVWNAGQAHWMSLAPTAQLISVSNTSHNIQLDRPDVVLGGIHELLQ
jgi:pimeloyl-ACP methyl ester carboxylesterase